MCRPVPARYGTPSGTHQRMRRRLAAGFVAVVVLALPAVVHAQIYVGRDDQGTLVLSDRPLGPGTTTFAVARTTAVRASRPAAFADAPYADLIDHHAGRHRLPADLVRAVIQVESAFNPWARSSKGAMGLMQLMPSTAVDLGVRDPYDPEANIAGGTAYLRQLLDRFDGNEELALAAYNAGPGAVERYGQQVPPYRETRDYVEKIKGRATVGRTRRSYVIYRTVEVVDGREVPRYTNVRPAGGDYEVVARVR